MKTIKLVTLILLLLILPLSLATAVPQMTDEQKEIAYESIKIYDEVLDAAVVQKDDTLSLALIVRYATSEETAKELGDSFVRMVKISSGDTLPGKEIGHGIYNYNIGVYYPDETKIVVGYKCTTCESIYW